VSSTKIAFDDGVIALLQNNSKKVTYTDNAVKRLQLVVYGKPDGLEHRQLYEGYRRVVWMYRGRNEDNQRTQYKLGEWPKMSAIEALEKAAQANARKGRFFGEDEGDRKAISLLRDEMVAIKQRCQSAVPPKYRVENLCDRFVEERKGIRDSTRQNYAKSIRNYIYPYLWGVDYREITAKSWARVVEEIIEKSGSGAGNNAHRTLRAVFTFAVDKELTTVNPLLQNKTVLESTKIGIDQRYLDSMQVHKFLTELDDQVIISEQEKRMLKLMLRCGVRKTEWHRIRVEWIDIHRGEIILPKSAMKAKVEAVTPLAPQAMELVIEQLKHIKQFYELSSVPKDAYLFPHQKDIYMKAADITDRTSRMKSWLDFYPKMMRKTIETHIIAKGCPTDVAIVIGNRTIAQGVHKHYQHAKLTKAKREWLFKWNDMLDETVRNPHALAHDEHEFAPKEVTDTLAGLIG